MSQLLSRFCRDFDSEYYLEAISVVLHNKLIKDDSLRDRMIMTKLKKLRFFNFIRNNAQILQLVPPKVLGLVEEPFNRAASEGFDFYESQ